MASSHPQPDWKPLSAKELSALLPDTYKVLDLLGRGGMGAVYLARQVNLDRLVAIKVLPLQDAAQADDEMNFAERFVQEARTMARISHNGIVAVFDFGRVKVKPANRELLYFVMEYMDGTDVLHLLQEQRTLKPDDALSITAHVCDALAFAHEKGMIHRDIKPANVMINADGFVKVADFGLARPVSMNSSAGLTQSGFAVGTPDFMAPEMLTVGGVTDHRADLYAVGVMLYQMLTGQIPRGSFKPASALCGCDRRFDAIIDKAMQSNPADRYASAEALRADLDLILATPRAHAGDQTSAALKKSPAAKRKVPAKGTPPGGGKPLVVHATPPSAKPPPPKPAQGRFPLARVVALLVAGGVGFAAYQEMRKPAPAGAPPVASPATLPVSSPSPAIPKPSDVSDRSDTSGKPTTHSLLASADCEWSAPEPPGTLVNSDMDDSSPCLSPNGLELYFDSPRGQGLVGGYDLAVCRRDSLTAPWRERENLGAPVNSTQDDRFACLSADGLTLIFSSNRDQPGRGIYRFWQCVRTSTSDPWLSPTLLPMPAGSGSIADVQAALSADGLQLVFHSSHRGGEGGNDLWEMRRPSTAAAWGEPANLGRLINTSASETDPALSADGRTLIFVRDENSFWVATRAAPGQVWSTPKRLTIPQDTTRPIAGPSLSPDGGELYFHTRVTNNNWDIRVSRRVKNPAGISSAAVTPQSPMTRASNPPDRSDPADSTSPFALLTSPDYEWSEPENLGTKVNSGAHDESPSITGDGLTLWFNSWFGTGKPNNELWHAQRSSVDSSWSSRTKVDALLSHEAIDTCPEISADGLRLIFASQRDTGFYRLWQSSRESPASSWSPPTQIRSLYANSPGNVTDDHSALAANGLLLVFRSDSRRGGQGKHDLWATGRLSTRDEWGPPANLGSLINGPESESSPVLSPDGRALLFRRDKLWWISTRATTGPEMNWGPPMPHALPAEVLDGCLSADGTDFIGHAYRGVASGFNDLELVRCRRVRKTGAGVPPAMVTSDKSDKSDLSDQAKAEPWLADAKKRGGKLRVFGTDRDGRPMSAGPAEKYEDFTEVHVYSEPWGDALRFGWLALRANRDAVVAVCDNDRQVRIWEERGVAAVNRGWMMAYRLADGSGKWLNDTRFEALPIPVPGGGDRLLAMARGVWAVDTQGRMSGKFEGSSVKHPLPVDFFVGARDWVGTDVAAVVIGDNGTVKGWHAHSTGVPLKTFATGNRNFVEGEGISYNTLLLRDSVGAVRATNWAGDPPVNNREAKTAPTDLPPAIRVRGGTDIYLAQAANGRWRSWGEGRLAGHPLDAQIDKLGPALDMDAAYLRQADKDEPGPHGLLLCIEPVGPPKSDLSDRSDKSDVKINPALAPKPAAVPWPVEQPWLREARRQGGRLKTVGTYYDGTPIDLGPAATLDDVVEVHAYGSSWIALRADGSGVVARKPDSRPWQFDKEASIAHVSSGWKSAYRRGNGEVKILQNSEWLSMGKLVVPDAGGFVATHVGSFVPNRAGQFAASWQDASTKPVPADFLTGARDYSSAEMHLLAIGADGIGRAWVATKPDSSPNPSRLFPAPLRDLVQCEGVENSAAVLRTRLGRVYVCDLGGKLRTPSSDSYPPADLPPSVRVRGGTRIYASQSGDGTWRAWGDNQALAALINKIGPAIDLDAKSPEGDIPEEKSRGYALYIEPQPGAQTRKPAPKPPPREALSFGRSRYLFVPILGCEPPHWDGARLRAEELGGRLAQFETPAEQQWVAQNVAANRVKPGQLAWVGGFAESKADGWRWVDGRPLGQAAWRPGQPDAGSSAGAGDFPAFLSLRNVQGGLALHDESDSAEGPHAWPGALAGFIVEWEP